jgi:hypothetical protein
MGKKNLIIANINPAGKVNKEDYSPPILLDPALLL